jgi:hypothetical protein
MHIQNVPSRKDPSQIDLSENDPLSKGLTALNISPRTFHHRTSHITRRPIALTVPQHKTYHSMKTDHCTKRHRFMNSKRIPLKRTNKHLKKMWGWRQFRADRTFISERSWLAHFTTYILADFLLAGVAQLGPYAYLHRYLGFKQKRYTRKSTMEELDHKTTKSGQL